MVKYEIPSIELDDDLNGEIADLEKAIEEINSKRDKGLSSQVVENLRKKLKIKHVYHSNAIEGNNLTLRETTMILDGMEINNKPLKDTIEAVSLNRAKDYLYSLIDGSEPLSKRTLLELHGLIINKNIDVQSGVFRKNEVKIKGSKHTPPNPLDVQNHIEEMFKWINRNQHKYNPIVVASILHHWITWIHPFNDGNGRVSRLMLDFFLLQKGYPEIVIKIDNRDNYYDALISADSGSIIKLIELIVDNVIETSRLYEEAFNEEERRVAFEKQLKTKNVLMYEKQKAKHSYQYEVWKHNITSFIVQLKQYIDLITDQLDNIEVSIKEYEILTFEQYLDLSEDRRATNTWYISIFLRNTSAHKNVKLLFYFDRWKPYNAKPLNLLGVDIKDPENKLPQPPKQAFIKLWIATRFNGVSDELNSNVALVNIGTKDDILTFGIRDKMTKKVKTVSGNNATPGQVAKDFLTDILKYYLDIKL